MGLAGAAFGLAFFNPILTNAPEFGC